MKKNSRTIAIDRWSKYIWLAYCDNQEKIPMPIWYMLNDGMFFFNLSEYLVKYNVNKIIIWYPEWNEKIQQKIDKFIKDLEFIIDSTKTQLEKINEHYTTVQAWEIASNYRKNEKTDTIAAMIILQRWLEQNK